MTDNDRVRVFIAEDEAPLARVLSDHLESRGCRVSVAHDGRSTIGRLAEEQFDVVVLDIFMPEVDGLEVLRRVRAQPDPPEVIVLTGNGTHAMALSAVQLGAYDVLSKPCPLAELEVVVRRAGERRRLMRSKAARHSDHDGIRLEDPSTASAGDGGGEPTLAALEHVERDHIRRVLEAVGWHQGRAASILGISSKTLYRKIREFGFVRPAPRSPQ
jgi:DNA-binding NtrC family response regulator